MKIIVLVCFAFAFFENGKCFSDEEKTMIMNIHTECVGMSGITDAMIEQARTGDFPPDSEFKEYLLCFAKKAGVMNESGELQTGKITKMVQMHIADAAKADKMVETCLVNKETPQDTIFETAKCMFEVYRFF